MSSATAERAQGADAAAVLAQVQSLPHVRLERRSGAVTEVVFHARTVAHLDGERQRAEIAVSVVDLDRVLAEHRGAQRGPIGVTLRLISPSRVEAAVELIRRGMDEARYRWQLTSSNP